MVKRHASIDIAKLYERIAKMGAETQLARGEAAALIASCLAGGGETDRATRNRIGGQLDRSCQRGDDYQTGGLMRLRNRKFTVDEIARWAEKHYGTPPFSHLPTKPRDLAWNTVEGIALRGSGADAVLPGNLDDCHIEIRRLRATLRQIHVEAERAAVQHKKELHARLKTKE